MQLLRDRMDEKEKINLDLDFLEKGSPEPSAVKPQLTTKAEKDVPVLPAKSFKLPDTAKKWLTGFAVVGVFVLFAVLSNDSEPTYVEPSYSDGLVQTGEYRCSQYHHDRAGELEPTDWESTLLDSKTSQLSAESDRMDSESYTIENEYVDEYDQWSIDQHNARIDEFNAGLQSYRIRVSAHQADIDDYNSRVEVYNNYLIANCTRAY